MAKLVATIFLILFSTLTTGWGNTEHDEMHKAIAEEIESWNSFYVHSDPRLKHFSKRAQKFKGQHHEDAHDAIAGFIKLKIESELLNLHHVSDHYVIGHDMGAHRFRSKRGLTFRFVKELPMLLSDPDKRHQRSEDRNHWYWGGSGIYRSARNEIKSLLELLEVEHDEVHTRIAERMMLRNFTLVCLQSLHDRFGCKHLDRSKAWHKHVVHSTANGRIAEHAKTIHRQASHDKHVADHHHEHYAVHDAIQRFILGL